MLSGELPESETLLTDDAAAALARGDTSTETSTVPVRAAVQSIVEIELLTKLAADVVQLAEGDARAWAVARETMLLVVAQPRESEEEDAAGSHAAFDPIARIDGQLDKLRDVERSFVEAVLSGLHANQGPPRHAPRRRRPPPAPTFLSVAIEDTLRPVATDTTCAASTTPSAT